MKNPLVAYKARRGPEIVWAVKLAERICISWPQRCFCEEAEKGDYLVFDSYNGITTWPEGKFRMTYRPLHGRAQP